MRHCSVARPRLRPITNACARDQDGIADEVLPGGVARGVRHARRGRPARTLLRVALPVLAALLSMLARTAFAAPAQAADHTASPATKPASKQERCAPEAENADMRCRRKTTATLTARSTPSSPQKLYWGARADGEVYGRADAPWDLTTWNLFEQHAGKQMSLLHFGQPPPWSQPFDRNPFNLVTSRGAVPYVSMNSESVSLTSIADGSYDSYLTTWARAAKAYGKPFLFRWNWEMNGTWFSWGAQAMADPEAYVASWRHFHDIVQAVGATNVTWVWCPNTEPSNGASLSSLYPGSSYVDWTCIDGYNWGLNPLRPSGWQTFSSIFRGTYDDLLALAPGKPIMIGETASTEYGGSKAAWITDMLATQLPANFPQIKALAWFNWNIFEDGGYRDWPIESSASAQAAFASGISLPNYVTNNYGALPWLSKVVPPSDSTVDTPSAPTTPTASTPLPTSDQIKAALRADLAVAARNLRRLGIGALVRRRGFTMQSVDALLAGRFLGTLTSTPRGAGVARKVVLAKGSRPVSAAGRYALKVKLTRRGRHLLRRDRRARVRLALAFRDISGHTILARKSVRMRR
jgi:hypothetical protein